MRNAYGSGRQIRKFLPWPLMEPLHECVAYNQLAVIDGYEAEARFQHVRIHSFVVLIFRRERGTVDLFDTLQIGPGKRPNNR